MTALTPEERAYGDALADAVEMGVYGEDALKYADQMRGTMWFAGRVLHHAGVDFADALWESSLIKLLSQMWGRR